MAGYKNAFESLQRGNAVKLSDPWSRAACENRLAFPRFRLVNRLPILWSAGKRAIKIDTAINGEYHPDVAQDYNNIGIAEEGLGLMADAIQHYAKALEINESVFGKKHPKVAINMNNLANTYWKKGQLDKAATMFRAAGQAFMDTLGKEHRHTLTAIRNFKRVKAELKSAEKSKKTNTQ